VTGYTLLQQLERRLEMWCTGSDSQPPGVCKAARRHGHVEVNAEK